MGKENCKKLIEDIRQQCLVKGLSGIKGLGVLFRGIDHDFSKTLSLNEFVQGMQKYGITLTRDQLNEVFYSFDVDHSGRVDFREFLLALRGPMPQCRLKVIKEVFNKLDVIKDGELKVEDLQVEYRDNAMNHEKYRSGEWSVDQVLQEFLHTFDSKEHPDGAVTLEEFTDYYVGVSLTIDDDLYFDMMMRQSWGLQSASECNK